MAYVISRPCEDPSAHEKELVILFVIGGVQIRAADYDAIGPLSCRSSARSSRWRTPQRLPPTQPHLIVVPMATPTSLTAIIATYAETLMDFASSSSSFISEPR